MKNFLLSVIVALFSFAAASSGHATTSPLRDHPVPWPWGLEQPFPWSEIQGIWKISIDAGIPISYFTFKVVAAKKKSGLKQLIVNQIDAEHCSVIAKGVGIELNDVLRAQMITTENSMAPGTPFRLSIRAFSEEASPKDPIGQMTSEVMVLSMSDLDHDPDKNLHVQIGKTSANLVIKDCLEEKISF